MWAQYSTILSTKCNACAKLFHGSHYVAIYCFCSKYVPFKLSSPIHNKRHKLEKTGKCCNNGFIDYHWWCFVANTEACVSYYVLQHMLSHRDGNKTITIKSKLKKKTVLWLSYAFVCTPPLCFKFS